MRFFQIIDTQTGTKFNALAADVNGAKVQQAAKSAQGLAGRRGTVIEGARFEIEGETFDVSFHMEALQGSQPSRSERKAAPRYNGPIEHYDDLKTKAYFDSKGRGW